MTIRILFFLCFLNFSWQNLNSQTVFHFQYKNPLTADTTSCDALLLLHDNGTGYVRIKFQPKAGRASVLMEMPFQQEFPVTKDETTDTSWVICRGANPVIKRGDKTAKMSPLAFWLRFDAENGKYFPWTVTRSDMNMFPGENTLFNTSLITEPSELRVFVSTFFLPTEPFYKNLFDPKKRGELLTDEEKKTKMYLLIVANTKDSTVGSAAKFDIRRAIKTFTAVAKTLTIENNLIIDSVSGESYNRTNVLNAINKIEPQKGRDIVIFYYTGHGFTNPKQPRKNFPWLDLLYPFQKPRPEPRDSALNIEDIYVMLKQKGARLNLVISDCCNNRIEDRAIKKDAAPGQRGDIDMTKWNKTNLKTLFMAEKPLSILGTAASKGEKAACNDRYGGFYFNNFILALTSYFGYDKNSPLWSQIFADAQKQTIWQAKHTYCPEVKQLCHQTPPPPKVN
ncbi:MAG: caspase family protein [Sphingobacteriales bacterium]|nr:caspase family protein [Sphingobacteriales bacterium]